MSLDAGMRWEEREYAVTEAVPSDGVHERRQLRTPRNLLGARALVLGGSDGFEFVLLAVEIWQRRVVVRLACTENELTQTVSSDYIDQVREYDRRPGESVATFPRSRADDVFARVRLELADDDGTRYSWEGAHGPGWDGKTGITWARDHAFHPGPSLGAKELTITAKIDGEHTEHITLAIRR